MNTSIKIELTNLNQNIGEFEKKKDTQFFEKYLSEHLVFRRASGKVHTKSEFINSLMNSKITYHEITTFLKEINISDNGLSAVIESVVTVKIENEGKITKGDFRNLRFFTKHEKNWKISSWYNEKL